MTAIEKSPFFATTSALLVLATRSRWRRCQIGYVVPVDSFLTSLTIVSDQGSAIPAMAPEANDSRHRSKAEKEEGR
jgi:hypothetical protein